jgi:hypothetical protein
MPDKSHTVPQGVAFQPNSRIHPPPPKLRKGILRDVTITQPDARDLTHAVSDPRRLWIH